MTFSAYEHYMAVRSAWRRVSEVRRAPGSFGVFCVAVCSLGMVSVSACAAKRKPFVPWPDWPRVTAVAHDPTAEDPMPEPAYAPVGAVKAGTFEHYQLRILSSVLGALLEPSFVGHSGSKLEAYRCILRAPHMTFIVRVMHVAGAENAVLSAIKLVGQDLGLDRGFDAAQDSVRGSVKLTQWRAFIAKLEQARFWELKPPAPYTQTGGSTWWLEGIREGNHQFVWRGAVPEDHALRAPCLHLIALSGLDVPVGQPRSLMRNETLDPGARIVE